MLVYLLCIRKAIELVQENLGLEKNVLILIFLVVKREYFALSQATCLIKVLKPLTKAITE